MLFALCHLCLCLVLLVFCDDGVGVLMLLSYNYVGFSVLSQWYLITSLNLGLLVGSMTIESIPIFAMMMLESFVVIIWVWDNMVFSNKILLGLFVFCCEIFIAVGSRGGGVLVVVVVHGALFVSVFLRWFVVCMMVAPSVFVVVNERGGGAWFIVRYCVVCICLV